MTGMVGLATRAPYADALAWIEARIGVLPAEAIPVPNSHGRMLAHQPPAAAGWPTTDRAAIDGYAVPAASTEGASEYSPVQPTLMIPVESGAPMPAGTDAVLPYASADTIGPSVHALAILARGAGVERCGGDAPAGLQLPAGVLRPEALALLGLLGVGTVEVVRQPRVALVVAGPKSGPDVVTPMLHACIARDGGLPLPLGSPGALRPGGADLLLLAGRAGCGPDDDMPARLAAAGGRLDLHGIAFRPGESAGLGMCFDTPAILLPGPPLAALSIYEALAGPAIRRMGGRPGSADRTRAAVLGRKITSAVSMTDMVRVRFVGDLAMPLGPADTGGLSRAALSDGWVIVPDGQEGYPAGVSVVVHLAPGFGA